MNTPLKIVLSASRRTDIPAFYMDWFMEGISRGVFEIQNPYTGAARHLPATADTVHSIVFWSKNFGPFIDGGFEPRLKQMGFHLFFNFTINSESTALEPHVPPLSERLRQLAMLAKTNPPQAISWRFDPVCRYRDASGTLIDNTKDFEAIAARVAATGVTRCITSFMDIYAKVQKRTARTSSLEFIPFTLSEQIEMILGMQQKLGALNIHLQTCCESEVLQSLPPDSGVASAACIPNDLLMRLYGGQLSVKKDTGQRIAAGCGCKVSVDIGSYSLHPCFHNCLFCYANPAPPPGKPLARPTLAERGGQ